LRAMGKILLITAPTLADIADVCTNVVKLEAGRVSEVVDMSDVVAPRRIVVKYLGNVQTADMLARAGKNVVEVHQMQAPLPADPAAVRHEIVRRGVAVSLPQLLRAIERIREREQQVPAGQQRPWLAARAAAHSMLAQRGSRIALYDLREILARASGPMPWSDLLAAVAAIGDAPCLELLAAAYVTAGGSSHTDAWHRQLIDAFRAIVAREKITARHTVMKKIKQRWPDRWAELWTPTT